MDMQENVKVMMDKVAVLKKVVPPEFGLKSEYFVCFMK